ncbi:S-adenosyl-L-methionine-dependent methyltransferase [Desarmillaria tabescens]|uniref:S-adenosyl-L-methionine-dependent methyltransferase n=1 Tax=Armillaria tabescens TaxID=1929756 RepID=A0AA39K633_ARMTA|nr:S-adenosyl-L-methionine-dependent methyltransferase [Desarmillaria tabescens]KAK0455185.1 S-adenosyl-L-methionine-dependent methyltransferase [Desarmillaria tabescens]
MSHQDLDLTSRHGHDFTSANRDYFDKVADKHDDRPQSLKLAQRLAQSIQRAYPFNEESTTLLDFACGAGLMSRQLAPHCKSILGIDISQGMVDQYNTRVHNQGIPPEDMRALCIELKGEEGELDGSKFDVVLASKGYGVQCSMAYHHMPFPQETTKRLAFFVKPGGILLVTDYQAEDDATGFPNTHANIVAHKAGFNEEQMKEMFDGAGLGVFSLEKIVSAKMHGHGVKIFLAKGEKPSLPV